MWHRAGAREAAAITAPMAARTQNTCGQRLARPVAHAVASARESGCANLLRRCPGSCGTCSSPSPACAPRRAACSSSRIRPPAPSSSGTATCSPRHASCSWHTRGSWGCSGSSCSAGLPRLLRLLHRLRGLRRHLHARRRLVVDRPDGNNTQDQPGNPTSASGSRCKSVVQAADSM